jgi:hypothetical protein
MSSRFRKIVDSIAEFDEVIAARWREDDASVFLEVRTGDGRSQVVMIQLVESDEEPPVVHIMSEIGSARESLYEEMLLRNLHLRYARIALVEGATDRSFALVFAQPFAELDEVGFTRAFGEVTFMADGIERESYGEDRT